MKNNIDLTCITFLFIGVISLMSQQIIAKEVVVHIENIDVAKPGNIMVMLFDKGGFPKDHAKATAIEVIPAVVNKMIVKFSSVPAEFAIKVLHDEDEDGQVTKNWTGIIPAEGLGFSNGAKLGFGPPSFSRAKVKFADVTTFISIEIIYP